MIRRTASRPSGFFVGMDMMWQDLFAAVALAMVLEGLLPFLSPSTYRRVMEKMARSSDTTLRRTGLILMLTGVVLVYLLKSG